MTFVQTIEWTTSRIDEVRALQESWRDRAPSTGPRRITVSADRDRPGTYLTIVEFDSHEEAVRNSDDPRTGEFAAAMAELCDGPPVFRDLDVVQHETRLPEQAASRTDA